MSEKLLTVAAVSECIGLAPATLAKRRLSGGGPPFVKLGGRVLYPEGELQTWMAAQPRFDNTAQARVASDGAPR